MRTRRATSSRYLVVGFTISMAVAAAIGSIPKAQAQVDPNLQATINTFSPPLVVQPPSTPEVTGECKYIPTSAERAKFAITSGSIPLTSDEFAKLLDFKLGAKRRLNKIYSKISELTSAEACKAVIKAAVIGGTIIFGPKAQQTILKVTFPFNPTYETNVLKTNLNVHPDTSAGFGGNVQVTGPAGVEGRPFDLVGFGAGSASARYSAFPSKSFDAFTVQGFYQFFIGAYERNWTVLDPTNPKGVPQGEITVDTLALGFQNQTAFTPTYHTETADLFTPQIVLSRQNINLSGSSQCASAFQPSQHAFCYFANFALTAGQTFSDVVTLQNANLAAAATLGDRINKTDFVLSLVTVATARAYENVPGGRQDLLLQVGPNLTFTPNKCFNASLAVTYNRNYSSLRTAVWDGFVVQPTLNVIFPVEPPPDTGQSRCG
jgi:hypothetical protein